MLMIYSRQSGSWTTAASSLMCSRRWWRRCVVVKVRRAVASSLKSWLMIRTLKSILTTSLSSRPSARCATLAWPSARKKTKWRSSRTLITKKRPLVRKRMKTEDWCNSWANLKRSSLTSTCLKVRNYLPFKGNLSKTLRRQRIWRKGSTSTAALNTSKICLNKKNEKSDCDNWKWESLRKDV